MADLRGSLILLICAVALLGCTSCRTRPVEPVPRAVGGLLIRCQPDDAMVYVDDRFQGNAGTLSQSPLQLTVGSHRIEVRKDGFFPQFAEVTIVKGVRQQLEMTLRKEPF